MSIATGDQAAEWMQARIGLLTASRMCDAIAKAKTGWSASRKKYMIELIAEKLTGIPTVSYMSQAMVWGIETEPKARAAYESLKGVTVDKATFATHPVIPNCGASPDGYVLDDGLVEIKCPETRTHIAYLIDRKIDEDYVIQMQWQMACTGRKWVDFCMYDPRLPLSCSLIVTRVFRDDALIKGLEKLAIGFLQEMAQAMQAIESYHLASEDVA